MTPGFHAGIPSEQYHADPAPQPSLSSSLAVTLLRESPFKAWHCHPRLNPHFRQKHDGKFDIGTCSHSVLLERDESKIVIVDADDWRTKLAKEQREAARAAGKTALLARHYDDVRKMVDAARAFIKQSEIAPYWEQADSELTGIWREGPIWLRCRMDRITHDRRVIIDYKSTTDAAPEPFSRLLVRMDYHVQDAFYRRGARALGAPDPKFVFLAQSCEEPYECSLHACDPALQEIADAQVEEAIGLWRACSTKDHWPSHGTRIHYAMAPNYLMTEHEMRLQEMAA
jgi:hypothetical protein